MNMDLGESQPEKSHVRLGVLFPDIEVFRPGMGLELYEQFAVMSEIAAIHDAVTGSCLVDTVWYPRSTPELDVRGRAAAVLAVSLGFYRVFAATYKVEPDVFMGKGIGLVSALVAADRLDLEHAIHLVKGVEPAPAWFQPGAREVVDICGSVCGPDPMQSVQAAVGSAWGEPLEAGPAAETVERHQITALLEIGPGNAMSEVLNGREQGGFVVGALDRTVNAQAFLDNVNVRKFFNLQFLAERTLGQLAGTRNRHPGSEGQDEIKQLAAELKTMIRAGDLPTGAEGLRSPASEGQVRSLIDVWVRNGTEKGHSTEEIISSLHALEKEILIPVIGIAGLNQKTIEMRRERVNSGEK